MSKKKDFKLPAIVPIVKSFNKLTAQEKLELKNWLANTLNEEIKEVALSILDADKEDIDKMIANITRTIEELKEAVRVEGKIEIALALLDILDDEMIANKTKLPLEKVKALREESLKA